MHHSYIIANITLNLYRHCCIPLFFSEVWNTWNR